MNTVLDTSVLRIAQHTKLYLCDLYCPTRLKLYMHSPLRWIIYFQLNVKVAFKNGATPGGHELEKDLLLCQATQEIERFI